MFTGLSDKMLGASPTAIQELLARYGFASEILTGSRADLFVETAREYPLAGSLKAHIQATVQQSDYVLSIGASGGGFGALMHSVLARIDCYIGLSSFTTIDWASRKVDPRGELLVSVMERIIPQDEDRNIASFMKKRTPRTSIHLFYPDRYMPDRYHADNLAEFPMVTRYPQDSDGHGMKGAITDFLAEIEGVLKREGIPEYVDRRV